MAKYGYALREITYDIPAEDKKDISEEIKKIYLEYQADEAEDNGYALEQGTPEDELDWEYKEPYSPDLPAVKALTEKYEQELYRNEKGLLSTMVVDIGGDESLVDKDALIASVEAVYQCKIKSAEDYGAATLSENYNSAYVKAMHRIIETKNFQSMISLKTQMQSYSSKNLAIILYHKPDAEFLRTYNGWKDYNRFVKKGTKSIPINCFSNARIATKEQLDKVYHRPKNTMSPKVYDRNLEKINSGEVVFLHEMFTINLFDVSDTELYKDRETGEPLKDIYNEKKHACEKALRDVADKDKYNAVATVLAEANIPVISYDGTMDSIYKNLYNYAETIFRTKPDSIIGIRESEPLKGDSHTLETLFAVGMIAEQIGAYQLTDTVSAGIGEVFLKNRYSNKADMLSNTMQRGFALSDKFVKDYEKHCAVKQMGKDDKNKDEMER